MCGKLLIQNPEDLPNSLSPKIISFEASELKLEMSNSQNFLDNKSSGKEVQKSNYATTCNLLTQYLKKKGKLKDLIPSTGGMYEGLGNFSISQNTKTFSTKNLFNSLGDLNQPPTKEKRPQDYSFQYTTVGSHRNTEDSTYKASTSKEAAAECKSAQMTIFYNGKVSVFDSLPAEKAQELMILASKGNNNDLIPRGSLSTTICAEKINLVGSSTSTPPVNLLVSTSLKEKAQVQYDGNNSGLPIARRSSLHRFLDKRKERSITRAPYQVEHDAIGSSSTNDHHLELKL